MGVGDNGGVTELPRKAVARTAKLAALPVFGVRRRQIPVITIIDGDSFGGSSFHAALSDIVVQVRGSCLAVTSPRVIQAATGEVVSNDELGGADVGAAVSGQVDLVSDSTPAAIETAADLLGYLPDSSDDHAPRRAPVEPELTGRLTDVVTANRRRA